MDSDGLYCCIGLASTRGSLDSEVRVCDGMLTQNAGKVFGWGHDDGDEVHPRRGWLNLGDVRKESTI